MWSNGLKLSICSLFACAALGITAFAGAQTQDEGYLAADEEQGTTIPSKEVELAFNTPGLIDEVKVKDGDLIKKGDLLATQDTAVEEAALAREEFLLKSNVQARAAEAQRDLAKVNLERAERLLKSGGAGFGGAGSQSEYDQAKVEHTIAILKVELAAEETEAKRLDLVKLRKQIERMRIVSPIDGYVRKVEAAEGEVSDPQKPSIIVVTNNPLKVETKIPTRIANTLKLGQTLQVRYVDEQKWREAKITYFDPVADPSIVGGGEQPIHLELANPENRRAGQQVAVKLPSNLAAAE